MSARPSYIGRWGRAATMRTVRIFRAVGRTARAGVDALGEASNSGKKAAARLILAAETGGTSEAAMMSAGASTDALADIAGAFTKFLEAIHSSLVEIGSSMKVEEEAGKVTA